ncbi:MAG: hypothetical protein JRF69_02780 [Deltaproteobacteria bacterium]|nr:hypothetical protein [Deltaproteobacteria bacterium]MBW2259769.1 hypothetical protein [Deltaproteobacteria bacterium]
MLTNPEVKRAYLG